jgi:hypothetical protein
MFDEKTLAERDLDPAILALFREWKREVERVNDLAVNDEAAAEANTAVEEIEETIIAMPAAGIAGFAVKLAIQINYEGIDAFKGDTLAQRTWRSLFEDAARLVPELADFVEWLRAQEP